MMSQHSTKEQVMNVILVDLPRDDLLEQLAATFHIDSRWVAT